MLYFFKKILIVCILLTVSSCARVVEVHDTIMYYIPYAEYLPWRSNYRTLKIKSNKNANDGAPFYLMVKTTDFPKFLSEDYEKVVGLLGNPLTDDPCFGIYCIIPGWNQKFTIEVPDNVKAIGIYFFFTAPGDIWKQIIELEECNKIIKIELEDNEIMSIK